MGRDYFTEEGAQILKEKIEAYWNERGHTVRVTFKKGAFAAALRSARTDVRSDMSNGLPSKPLLKDGQD